jgi:urease accessory protein
MSIRTLRLAAALGLLPAIADAHPGHELAMTFAQGLMHPLSGVDHLLAMLAIGLWTAQLPGRLRWILPSGLLALLLAAAMLGLQGTGSALPPDALEQGIAASVLICGLALVRAGRLPLASSLAFIGGFAVLHGYAHGVEAARPASPGGYLLGMALASLAVYATGYGGAHWLQRRNGQQAIRWLGAACVVAGAALLVS